MSAARRTSRLVASALALLSVAAEANGRFPNAQWLAFGPAGDVVVLQTTFGMLLSRDAARTFQWTCEEAMFAPLSPPPRSDTPVAVVRDGRVVFGTPDGVHVLADGCGVTSVGAAPRQPVDDLAWTPDGAQVFAIETPAAGPHRVLRAAAPDYALAPGATTDVRLNAVDVAPSQPRTLYLSGVAATGGAPVLLRSDDGGDTLRALAAELPSDATPYVSGVDPRDPETLWVRAVVGVGSALYLSRDGGRSLTRVATAADRMLGFAISEDGASVWYGSPVGGLYRSDDGGRSFARVSRLPIVCLRAYGAELWACTDWVQQPWALGRSRDGGGTFEGVLRWAELQGPDACPSGSTVASMCAPLWGAQRRLLVGIDVLPDAGATRDAGRPPPSPSGCGCRAQPSGAGGAWIAAVAAALYARRRLGVGMNSG